MIYKDGFLNDYFLDKHITLQESTWSIDGLIQEHRLRAFDTAEAIAVFHCLKLEPNPGIEGILKIRARWFLRRPYPIFYIFLYSLTYDFHSIPEYNEPENKNVNYLTEQELQILQVLTKTGCSSAPKLLAEARFTQSEDMCDPGGYVMCIVMEALPGVPLDPNEYWEFDREKRDRIRKAFQLALMYVCLYGFTLIPP